MKLRLHKLLRAALLACMGTVYCYSSSALADITLMAEGVDREDLEESVRFYDGGKGYYWGSISGAKTLYNQMKSYEFLGELESRVKRTGSSFSSSAFSSLTDDSDACWAYTAANLIQYWQTYYGVFYTGDQDLPYGLTYDRRYLDDLGGTQSLEVNMAFYDAWRNKGGGLSMALGWYMAGEDYDNYMEQSGKGGYFKNYYPNASSSYTSITVENSDSMNGLRETLISGLGYTRKNNGTLEQTVKGNILFLALGSIGTGAGVGHAITCYGVTLNNDGSLKSIQVTNSDDMAFKMFDLYVAKDSNGNFRLYTDAACKNQWRYAGYSWALRGISYIETPTELLNLYASYHDASTPLTWTGAAASWKNTDTSTLEELPDKTSGWDVVIGGTPYHSYYVADRPVMFDDSASQAEVKVDGLVHTKELFLNNTALDYTFTGVNSATITADKLTVQGRGSAVLKNVTLNVGDISLTGYSLGVASGGKLQSTAVNLGTSASLTLQSGTITANSLNMGYGSSVSVSGSGNNLTLKTLDADKGASFIFDPSNASSLCLTLSGSVLSGSAITIKMDESSCTSGTRYKLISFSNGLSGWQNIFTTHQGTLSYSNNTLYLTYAPMPQLTWTAASGTWSASSWQGSSVSSDYARTVFSGSGAHTVTISGTVTPESITIADGSYTFVPGSSTAQIFGSGDIIVSAGASLTQKVAQAGGSVYLDKNATVSYDVASDVTLAYVESGKYSVLSFNNSAKKDTNYILESIGAFEGDMSLGSHSQVTFDCLADTQINGNVMMDETAELTLRNASAGSAITYTFAGAEATMLGTVMIGDSSGKEPLTSLALNGNVSAAEYHVYDNGNLTLRGEGTFAATVTGTGTLTVAQGATQNFTFVDGKYLGNTRYYENGYLKTAPDYEPQLTVSKDIFLNVEGAAIFGSSDDYVYGRFVENMQVSGNVTFYATSEPLWDDRGTLFYVPMEVGTLSLDGGTCSFVYSDVISNQVYFDELHVTSSGGSIESRSKNHFANPSSGSKGPVSLVSVDSLTGSGDVEFRGYSLFALNCFKINRDDDYTGNIVVANSSSNCPNWTQTFNMALLELSNCDLPGYVHLKQYNVGDTKNRNRVVLGIASDVRIGGLSDNGGSSTHLYSGKWIFAGDISNALSTPFESFYEASEHTLTIDANSDYSFGGKVYGSLNLVKTGEGIQQFNGDMSSFNGSIEVLGGTLHIKNSFTATGTTINNSTLSSNGIVTTGNSLLMSSSQLKASGISSKSAVFRGVNSISANSVSGTSWTLYFDASQKEQSLLCFRGVKTMSLSSLTLQYSDVDNLINGDECMLMEFDTDVRSALSNVTLAGEYGGTTIGKSSDLYFTTRKDGTKTYYTLMLKLNDESLPYPFTTAIWANKTGDNTWNTTSVNWVQGNDSYAYADGVDVVFGDSNPGIITLVGDLLPASVTVENSSGKNYTWRGTGNICGSTSLVKKGAGTLTIENANSYTGGTQIKGGTIVVKNAGALGSGAVSLNGGTLNIATTGFNNKVTAAGVSTIAVANGYTLNLTEVLQNSGTLTLSGSFCVDALSAQYSSGSVFVDMDGKENSTGGFRRSGDLVVTVATGTVKSSAANVTYKGQVLTMTGGVGHAAGYVDYSHYLLNTSGSTNVSALRGASGDKLESITQVGGTLVVDENISVDATDGNIRLTKGGSLSGSITDSVIRVAAGTNSASISAELVGASSLTLNSGTVTLSGNNSHTGGIKVNGGKLVLGHSSALGQGVVELSGGTLDLSGYGVSNDIEVSGATLSGASNFSGHLLVKDDLALSGTTNAVGGVELNSGSITGGRLNNADIVVNGSGDMSITSTLAGSGSLELNSGSLTVTGKNSYSGGTTVNGGTLILGHTSALGSGTVVMNGGVFDMNGFDIDNNITMNGGLLVTDYELTSGRVLTIGENGMTLEGSLSLDGGTLQFNGTPLEVIGEAIGKSAVQVVVSSSSLIDAESSAILATFDSSTGVTTDSFVYTGTGTLRYDAGTHTLTLTLAERNTWLGGKGATWTACGALGWENGSTFEEDNRVLFNTGGSVSIVGEVEPSSVLVNVDKSLTFKTSFDKKTQQYSGAIVGDGCLVKRGKGTLTLNDGNGYTGGTHVEAGTVKAKGLTSFGTGAITLLGGTVDLASKAVANAIVLDGSAVAKGGKAYAGTFTMTGGELLKGSLLNIAKSATVEGGTINGTLSGAGKVSIVGDAFLGNNGKITTNKLDISGSLTVLKSMSMNSKVSAITLAGGTLSTVGKVSAYRMTMNGGLLDATNGKPAAITLAGTFSTSDNAEINLYGTFAANQLRLKDSCFTLAMDEADVTAKLKPKAQSISIKGVNVSNTLTDSLMDVAGKMSVSGNLTLTDSSIFLHDVAGAYKPKGQGLTVKGALSVTGGYGSNTSLDLTGVLSVAALSATDTVINVAAQEGLAAQSVKLTRKDQVKGVPQENALIDSAMYINGSMSVAGSLALEHSVLRMRDYSGKNKAKGLSVKGDLTVGSGSLLSLTGALSAKNLTLEAGSYLMLGSAKLSTVKVGGALTLNGVVDFDLGFTVTEKDVAKGKAYTLFSFKSFEGNLEDLTLGYEGEYTLALNAKGTAITLTVTDAAAWNAYVADIQESLNTAPALADSSAATPEEEVEAEELLLKPVSAAADVDPLLAKVADTLVQSTWGTVGASRAFGGTIASRGRNATLLDDGKGAAWLSVMGGSSRISSAEGHNGADFTLSGAAFGVESRVGEKSTLGVAVGNSWGKVSTFSAFPVDQDSMHVGIYGNHTLTKSLTLSWMATHTRTESEATILGAPYSWSQDALQLDARLTWGKSISEKTAVSAFAGLQYLATDSGECAGLKTGSLQNLRAELGVGASHKLGENTLVFGELSFIGDMVRNNPTASIGDYRTHGTNPGRVGLNLSVGAQHQLSEDWSVNASYSLELMENSTSHSLNVGASYSF